MVNHWTILGSIEADLLALDASIERVTRHHASVLGHDDLPPVELQQARALFAAQTTALRRKRQETQHIKNRLAQSLGTSQLHLEQTPAKVNVDAIIQEATASFLRQQGIALDCVASQHLQDLGIQLDPLGPLDPTGLSPRPPYSAQPPPSSTSLDTTSTRVTLAPSQLFPTTLLCTDTCDTTMDTTADLAEGLQASLQGSLHQGSRRQHLSSSTEITSEDDEAGLRYRDVSMESMSSSGSGVCLESNGGDGFLVEENENVETVSRQRRMRRSNSWSPGFIAKQGGGVGGVPGCGWVGSASQCCRVLEALGEYEGRSAACVFMGELQPSPGERSQFINTLVQEVEGKSAEIFQDVLQYLTSGATAPSRLSAAAPHSSPQAALQLFLDATLNGDCGTMLTQRGIFQAVMVLAQEMGLPELSSTAQMLVESFSSSSTSDAPPQTSSSCSLSTSIPACSVPASSSPPTSSTSLASPLPSSSSPSSSIPLRAIPKHLHSKPLQTRSLPGTPTGLDKGKGKLLIDNSERFDNDDDDEDEDHRRSYYPVITKGSVDWRPLRIREVVSEAAVDSTN